MKVYFVLFKQQDRCTKIIKPRNTWKMVMVKWKPLHKVTKGRKWYQHNKLCISEVSQNDSPIVFRLKGSNFQSIISRWFWYFWASILKVFELRANDASRKRKFWDLHLTAFEQWNNFLALFNLVSFRINFSKLFFEGRFYLGKLF